MKQHSVSFTPVWIQETTTEHFKFLLLLLLHHYLYPSDSLFSKGLLYWTRTKMGNWAAGTWRSYSTRKCPWSTVPRHFSSQSQLILQDFFLFCKHLSTHSNIPFTLRPWTCFICLFCIHLQESQNYSKTSLLPAWKVRTNCIYERTDWWRLTSPVSYRDSWCKSSVSCNMLIFS